MLVRFEFYLRSAPAETGPSELFDEDCHPDEIARRADCLLLTSVLSDGYVIVRAGGSQIERRSVEDALRSRLGGFGL